MTSMAALILSAYVSNPFLTIAQGTVESGLNQFAVGKLNEKGAFQVRESIWGKTPKHFYGQAKQHEVILNMLVKETNGDIWKAVKRYNGQGRKANN